jgi:hypothetical protein
VLLFHFVLEDESKCDEAASVDCPNLAGQGVLVGLQDELSQFFFH